MTEVKSDEPDAPLRLTAPFGVIEQRETQRLRALGFEKARLARAKGTIVALRERLDRRTGWCNDSIASLSKWSGVSPRDLTRALGAEQDSLVRMGIVELGPASTVVGGVGRGGLRTYQPRRVRPFEDWPCPPGAANPADAHATTAQPKSERLRQNDRLLTPKRAIGHAPVARNPERPPDVSPDDVVESKAVAGALDLLRGFDRYQFDAVRDRALLRAEAAARPDVDVLTETRKWIDLARQSRVPSPRAALTGWLRVARPSPHKDRERFCEFGGCQERGYGSLGLCNGHRRLGNPVDGRGVIGQEAGLVAATAANGAGAAEDTDAKVAATNGPAEDSERTTA